MSYTKHYIPLECNPDLFTQLIHKLANLTSQDVFSLDPDMLAFVQRPVLALILVFPTSDVYEKEKAIEESAREDYEGRGEAEDVTWFKQTINNACGFYGILHAICNGEAREMMGINTAYVQMYYLMTKLTAPDSIMARILSSCVPLGPADRAKVIEDSEDVESAYRTAALQGETGVPENAEDEVDFHYVYFVKSSKTGHLYELDGDRKGPVDHGILKAGEDFLSGRALSIIENFISREKGQNVNFCLSALVRGAEGSTTIG